MIHKNHPSLATLVCLGLALTLPATAHATKKVYSPYVEQGELEFEVNWSLR